MKTKAQRADLTIEWLDKALGHNPGDHTDLCRCWQKGNGGDICVGHVALGLLLGIDVERFSGYESLLYRNLVRDAVEAWLKRRR